MALAYADEKSSLSTERCESLDEKTRLLKPKPTTSTPKRQSKKQLQIEQIHEKADRIKAVRKVISGIFQCWEELIGTARLRNEAWKNNTEVEGFETDRNWNYDTRFKYSVSVIPDTANVSWLSIPKTLDFTTPEGREAAVAWYEHAYDLISKWKTRELAEFDQWESTYRAWNAGKICWLRRAGIRQRLNSYVLKEVEACKFSIRKLEKVVD